MAGTCEVANDGTFTLGGLKNGGSVKLRFESFVSTHRSVFYMTTGPGWTSDNVAASLVSTNASNVNITLPAGVAIQGEILTTSGELAAGTCLSAMASDWRWVSGTCSPDGRFSLNGLPSDPNLRVWVQPPRNSTDQRGGWLSESGGVWSLNSSPSTVSAMSTVTGVVASLSAGVKLVGQVTPPSVPTCVMAFDASTVAWLARGCTDSTGTYSINGLPPSTQVWLYVEPQGDEYKRDWVRSGGNPESISSSSGTKSIALVGITGGSISGKVTQLGVPVPRAIVLVKQAGALVTASAVAVTSTKSDGTYTIRGLADGTYDLYVVDGSNRFVEPAPILGIAITGSAAVGSKNFSVVAPA